MGLPPESGGFHVTVNDRYPDSMSIFSSAWTMSAAMLPGWVDGIADVVAQGPPSVGVGLFVAPSPSWSFVAWTRTSKETPRPVEEPLRRSLRAVITTVRLLMSAVVRATSVHAPATFWSLAVGELRGTNDSRYSTM